MPPVRLSPATVQYLAAAGLKVSPASALAPVVALTGVEQSHLELDALGIPHSKLNAAAVTAKGRAYLEALETLAAPEATVALSEVITGQPNLSVRLVLGKGRGVIASIDELGLNLTPPMPYNELVKAFTRHFENTPAAAEERSMWPSQLKTLTHIFTTDTGPFETSAPKATLKARLESAGIETADAVLAELTLSGFIEERANGIVALTENTAFWLTRLGTGQMAELIVVTHDAAGSSTPAPTQLRFAGPIGDRITAVTLTGEDLKKVAGDAPSEPMAVSFAALDRTRLAALFEAFLGIERR